MHTVSMPRGHISPEDRDYARGFKKGQETPLKEGECTIHITASHAYMRGLRKGSAKCAPWWQTVSLHLCADDDAGQQTYWQLTCQPRWFVRLWRWACAIRV